MIDSSAIRQPTSDGNDTAGAYLVRGHRSADEWTAEKSWYALTKVLEEITPTMLVFQDETHVIRIVNDRHGHLEVVARHRQTGEKTVCRFPKFRHARSHRLARNSTYLFKQKRPDRLQFLGIEPSCVIAPAVTPTTVTR